MVSETVNLIVNNLAGTIEPVIKSVNTISQKVVAETANCGFAYTMIGVGMWCAALFCVGLICWTDKHAKSNRNNLMSWAVAGFVVFLITGFFVVMNNIRGWIAPTREVIREIVNMI